ncbi:MAG: hypothetical protein E7442_09830 [Ruminococcaceae bacterium]|nr:hypothetical protein [Oscillospiraceae bacterium]
MKNRKKIKGAQIFTAMFLALCLLPGLGMLIFGESAAGANEVLANAPKLKNRDGSFNTEILSDLADYMGDRFFLRQEAITGWNAINTKLLKDSPAQNVIPGRDGWLYYADTLPDYSRSAPLSERELYSAARIMAQLQEYAESRDCRFVFTLCPNKNSLYDEHMPTYPRMEGSSNAERLGTALLAEGVNYLDLFALFETQEETLYFATDSHWNAKGAALGADALLAAVGKSGGWFDGGFTEGERHKGDLYDMLYPAGGKTEADQKSVEPFTYAYVSSYRAPTDITIQTAREGESGSLLMFRDSFGNNSFPYLAERFGAALFSRSSSYDLSRIDECAADSVIIELVERNISYIWRYLPVFPAPEREVETAASAAGPVAAAVKKSNLEGYALLTGDVEMDTAPVHITDGSAVWEAMPTPTGFAAHLPTDAEGNLPALQLVYTCDGIVTCSPIKVNNG